MAVTAHEYQRYVLKIHSSRLRNHKWALTLPLDEARKNDEVVALASSQVLRWIDELNGLSDSDARAREIRSEIRSIKSQPYSIVNRHRLRQLYSDLDKLQFKPDYLCLIADRISDYRRACRGFTVNGIRYMRLLGTPGGIKKSTVVFVSERVCGILRDRIDCGRDLTKMFIPAKLEAYRALSCSASTPVSFPNGILVVPDAETEFEDTVIDLSSDTDGEPIMSEPTRRMIRLTISDGCGMMSPELARRWSEELGLGYLMSGCNSRCAYEKGMVYTFPFREYADKIGRYTVKDAWGNEADIRNVELVLTTSMLKLWDSFESIGDYLSKCKANGYTFAVTKACPQHLENERSLNYQFINCYDLSDEDIEELTAQTRAEFTDVLGGDWRKAVLFLAGSDLTEKSIRKMPDDFIKALMACPDCAEDPFIRKSIYRLIRKRIDDAKVGVLKVHGNYSMMSGDLYGLCQSIFGEPVTGLLRAGEIWNAYWADTDAETLVGFRAPMSVHSNVRRLTPARREEVRHWFRYMTSCTVMSAWSNEMNALNGCDFDGDLLMLTDNPVLVRKHKVMPVLMCGQSKGVKCIPTEDDLIQGNIASFGCEVGRITNRCTSMYDVQSQFSPDSEEYKLLAYRICCLQQAQQDSIDKAKGIISKPMPRAWYDRKSITHDVPLDKQSLYRSTVADKKPYFMRYVYQALAKQYNDYTNRTNQNALREFGISISEMHDIPADNLTERQMEFLLSVRKNMPVSTHSCVTNRVCRLIENEFDGFTRKVNKVHFDYSIYKSDAEYTYEQKSAISRLIAEYKQRVRSYCAFASIEYITQDDMNAELAVLEEEFRERASMICPNEESLCNAVIDLCYSADHSKRFAWKVCGAQIIRNLMRRSGGVMLYPAMSDGGGIMYAGDKYELKEYVIGGLYGNYSE